MAVVILPVSAIPRSNGCFYAINNPFQESGPKGFTEIKVLENGDVFRRIDLPGVPKDRLTISIHPSKKYLVIKALAPRLDVRDSNLRRYDISSGLVCNCCEISTFVSNLSDGVLRLIISKTLFSFPGMCPYRFPYCSNPNDPALRGPELQEHPGVIQGVTKAYEFTRLDNGILYVRVDMPGVPNDGFTVSVANGTVRVSGQAPAISHDSAGRIYYGDVAMIFPPVDFPVNRIHTFADFGVLRLSISPL